MFHDRVIDGDFRKRGKYLREISGQVLQRSEPADKGGELRSLSSGLGQEGFRTPEKDSGIPEKPAVVHISDSRFFVGFFDKPL